jgi:hypothetical protein
MMRVDHPLIGAASIAVSLVLFAPGVAEAQGRGNSRPAEPGPTVEASISISLGDREIIQQFYAANPQAGAEALPPGIRRNLTRGKPLPPGIAKKAPPTALSSRITVPERFEIVEVGLDVFLVEAATGLIHDVLMDVIR